MGKPSFEKKVIYELKNQNGLPGGGAIEVSLKEFMEGIPDNVAMVCCSNMGLTELPEIPEGLYALQCEYNYLKELPPLPKSLKMLWCYENQIKEINHDLSGFNSVEAYGNRFTEQYKSFFNLRYQEESWYSPLENKI